MLCRVVSQYLYQSILEILDTPYFLVKRITYFSALPACLSPCLPASQPVTQPTSLPVYESVSTLKNLDQTVAFLRLVVLVIMDQQLTVCSLGKTQDLNYTTRQGRVVPTAKNSALNHS